jgi:hypothetical protein
MNANLLAYPSLFGVHMQSFVIPVLPASVIKSVPTPLPLIVSQTMKCRVSADVRMTEADKPPGES